MGMGVGDGVGGWTIMVWAPGSGVGDGVGAVMVPWPVVPGLSSPSGWTVTMTMTARITANTRIPPKIICHLVLVSARS